MKKSVLTGIIFGAILIILISTLLVLNSKESTNPNNEEISEELSLELQNVLADCIENGGSVCMPWDPSGKCSHYDTGAKSCMSITSQIKEGNLDINFCYRLEKEFLIAYCLSQTNLDECFKYIDENPSIEKVCKTVDCQTNGRDKYPSELNLSDSLESLEYKNCVDVWKSY